MRVGFFGTQSVGKTTLLNALRSEPEFKDFKFIDKITRDAAGAGLQIKELGNDETQMHIARKHMENIILHDKFVADRTMLDCFAYSVYLWRRQNISGTTMENIAKYLDFITPRYDYLFYIPIEFANVEDGLRSIDPEFRNEIDDIMRREFIEGFNVWEDRNIPKPNITTLSGSVVKRVNKVYDTVVGF